MPRRSPLCAHRFPCNHERRKILLGLLCGSALVSGHAQADTATSDVLTLPTISVKGGGEQNPARSTFVQRTAATDKLSGQIIDVPASVSAITQKEIANRAADSLTQALSFTSSVSVDEYGSDTRYDYFRIRGFAETGAGVYLDGLPQPTLDFTGAILEPYGLERLDVLKGSTSTLFGMNDPGGMANAISKRPTDDAFGETYTTIGQRHAEAGFDIGGPLNASGTLSYRLTGKWQDAKQDTKYQDDNRRYFAPALTWKPNAQTSLTVLLKYQQDDGSSGNAIPYGMGLSNHEFYGEPDYDDMNRTQRSIGYSFHHDFGNGLSFDQNARYSDVDLSYSQVYLSSYSSTGRAAYGVDGNLKSFNIDNRLQFDHDFGQVTSKTMLGYEFDHYDLHENSVYGTAGAIDLDDPVYCGLACIDVAPYTSMATTTLVSGLYLQEQLTLADRWILTLGGRKDWVKTDTGAEVTTNSQSAFTRRVGLTWKARPNLSLYANYSESFNPTASAYAT
ncbi:TonB-dependent siderophore receptor, partial [Thioclava sp. BHET1]